MNEIDERIARAQLMAAGLLGLAAILLMAIIVLLTVLVGR